MGVMYSHPLIISVLIDVTFPCLQGDIVERSRCLLSNIQATDWGSPFFDVCKLSQTEGAKNSFLLDVVPLDILIS